MASTSTTSQIDAGDEDDRSTRTFAPVIKGLERRDENGNRVLGCPQEDCFESFKRPYKLHDHHCWEHTNYRPYTCQICGLVLKTRDSRKHHDKGQHAPEPQRHHCTHTGCNKSYTAKHNLEEHVARKHAVVHQEDQSVGIQGAYTAMTGHSALDDTAVQQAIGSFLAGEEGDSHSEISQRTEERPAKQARPLAHIETTIHDMNRAGQVDGSPLNNDRLPPPTEGSSAVPTEDFESQTNQTSGHPELPRHASSNHTRSQTRSHSSEFTAIGYSSLNAEWPIPLPTSQGAPAHTSSDHGQSSWSVPNSSGPLDEQPLGDTRTKRLQELCDASYDRCAGFFDDDQSYRDRLRDLGVNDEAQHPYHTLSSICRKLVFMLAVEAADITTLWAMPLFHGDFNEDCSPLIYATARKATQEVLGCVLCRWGIPSQCETAVSIARCNGSYSNAALLQARLNDHISMQPLLRAIEADDLAAFTAQVEIAGPLNLCDLQGMTVGHWAAHFGRPTFLEVLIDRGVDEWSPDYFGRRPLHCATENRAGHSGVKRLLINDIMLDEQSIDGMTPRIFLREQGSGNIGFAQSFLHLTRRHSPRGFWQYRGNDGRGSPRLEPHQKRK